MFTWLVHRRVAFAIAFGETENITSIRGRPVGLFAVGLFLGTDMQDAFVFGDGENFVTERAHKDSIWSVGCSDTLDSFGAFQFVVGRLVKSATIRASVPRISLELEMLPKPARVLIYRVHHVKAGEPIRARVETGKTTNEGVLLGDGKTGKILVILVLSLFVDVESLSLLIIFNITSSLLNLFLELARDTLLQNQARKKRESGSDGWVTVDKARKE